MALGLGISSVLGKSGETVYGDYYTTVARIWYPGVWDTSMYLCEGVQRSKADYLRNGETAEAGFGFGFCVGTWEIK